MLRWLHAWGWTVLWLLIVGRSGHAFPVTLGRALVLGVLLLPGVYLPLRLAIRKHRLDASELLFSSLPVGFAGMALSLMVLGFLSVVGFWDKRPPSATMVGLAVAVVMLHLLASASIFLTERWLRLDATEDDE
ncbi:hypothetical protein [Ottowia sp.]|uniref:hypothetical protein n=1 Tax=Ottowia sp. TaxID=1898956 RepID=UPI00261FA7C7|nr:hypothetical protein [Ottowia sp.]